jgi:hypothetical protein
MLDLIWNLFQDEDLERLKRDAAQRAAQNDEERSKAGSVEARLLELEKRHEQLKLVTLALWRLLKERVGLNDTELRKYVTSTDLIDGALDGKVDLTNELVKCAKCGRRRLNTSIVCPFCGTRGATDNAFDTA